MNTVDSNLREKYRYTSSDLQMAENILSKVYYLLGLHKIGNITIIINSPWIKSGSCFPMGSSADDNIFNFIVRKRAVVLCNESLDNFGAEIVK